MVRFECICVQDYINLLSNTLSAPYTLGEMSDEDFELRDAEDFALRGSGFGDFEQRRLQQSIRAPNKRDSPAMPVSSGQRGCGRYYRGSRHWPGMSGPSMPWGMHTGCNCSK